MWDPGTSDNHTNRYDYGVLSRHVSIASVSWAMKIRAVAGRTISGGDFFFGVHAANSAGFRFMLEAGLVEAIVHNGNGQSENVRSDNALTDDVTYSVVARHDAVANTLRMDIRGLQAEQEETNSTFDPGATNDGEETAILSHPNVVGSTHVVGQCMAWAGYVLTDSEREQYHSGVVVPAPENLSFWEKCIAEPGADLIFGDAGTENGTVTLFGDDVDSMFSGQGFLLPHRQLPGHSIRILSCSPELYRLTVPPEYAALLLGSDVSIHDGELPAASSVLAQLNEHFMLDNYRGMDGVILEANIEPNMELSMLILNRLPAMSLFYQTMTLDKGHLVNNEEEGTASLVPWAAQTNSRNSQHYIEDATAEISRVQLSSVGRFSAKTNHLGTLYEVDVKQLVQNSAFLDDGAGPPTFLDTTEVLGTGGTVVEETGTNVPMLFTDKTIGGKAVRAAKLTKGSSGTVSLEWSLAIDGSGDDSRVLFWHRGEGGGGWWLIRTSDGNYWQTGSTWTAGAQLHTIDGSDDEWVREISAVIGGVPSTGTLRLIIGNSAGLENDRLFLAQTMAYQHWAILSDIVTQGGATETSEDDNEVWDLDNEGSHDAQTFNPNRGTVRVTIEFTTDSDDIPNSTHMELCRIGVDASNYDRFYLQTSAGGQFRLLGERVIAASSDAICLLNITSKSIGDELELTYRWVDATGTELGLAARTLSVFVDGVKGSDATASAIHSTSDQTTFIRWGNNGGSVFNLKVAYIKNVELVQWAIPDEGITARRISA